MALGKLITQSGLPNSTPVEYYLKIRGLTDKYPVEEVSVLPSDDNPRGQVREKLEKKMPFGAIPVLELADGTLIDQSNAILAYLEAAHPEGRLDGTDAKTIGINRSWNDRLEKSITEFAVDIWRTGPGLKMFANRYPCLAEAHQHYEQRVSHFLALFDKVVPTKGLLGGDKPNIADLRMCCVFEFLTNKQFGAICAEEIEKNANVAALFKRQREYLAAL